MDAILEARLAEIRERVETGERATPTRRTVAFDEIEVRATDDKIVFVGHAAVFDKLSEDLGGFKERIQRGAFRKVLDKDPDVRFLFNHDVNHALARTTVAQGPGLLELREDPKGLRSYAELVPTSFAKDLRMLVQSGVVSQMSFSFSLWPDGTAVWDEEGGELVRTIISFDSLFDVGPVVFPAYTQTDASMRALVRGVEIVNEHGQVVDAQLRDLAWKHHRGELVLTTPELAVVDAAYARTNTVSPWIAQRALEAASQEPELRGAIPGKRVTVLLEDEAPVGEPDDDTPQTGEFGYRHAARRRRLALLTHELRGAHTHA